MRTPGLGDVVGGLGLVGAGGGQLGAGAVEPLLADVGEVLAALPQRERLLERRRRRPRAA